MIKREVRDKRIRYYKSSKRLRELSAPCGEESSKQINKIRKSQNELYMKWRFYDGFIKASEKHNSKFKEELIKGNMD